MSNFEKFLALIENIGYVQTIIAMVIIIIGIWGILSGILPVLVRLGKGLAKRRIAIFAKGDNLKSLRDLLIDSQLFKKNNIIEVSSKDDFGRAEGVSVLLVFWHDWQKIFDRILSIKKDDTALIIYAPTELGKIPAEKMKQINERRNSTVTNFRGRLMNDLVITMITSGYGRRKNK